MKKTILSLLFAALCAGTLCAGTPEGWTADFDGACKRAAKEKKLLYVLFTGSDWCPWCIKLHKEVLDRAAFRKFAEKHFVLVYIDFPRKTRTFGPRNNEILAKKYGVEGFPTAKVMTPDGKVVHEIGGAMPEKEYLEELAKALPKPAGK